MEQFFTDLLLRAADIPVVWGYALILFIAWLENVFPPIPGDVLIVFGGYLAAVGPMLLLPVIIFSTLGGAIGFMCMYYVGRYGGPVVLKSRAMRWIPDETVSRVQDWIDSWGYWVVTANRFLSGARTVISFTVGMSRMPALPVAVFASLSAAVWVSLIATLGYMVGDEWERVTEYLSRYGRFMSALIALFLVWQIYKAVRRIRAHRKGGSS